MEEDVVPVTEDEDNFDPQDLLGDPARHEISQTSLEIMQLLAECEGGHEVFGNIHQGNFIYDSASLVGSSSELSDIFQDDGPINAHSGHRLDDILVKSIDSLSKSPKKKTSKCQDDSLEKKKPRKSKETLNEKTSQKSSNSKTNFSRRKKGSEGNADGKRTRKRRVKLSRSPTSDDIKTGKQLPNDESISSSTDSISSLHYEKNKNYKIGENGTYTCHICGKIFSVLKSLQIHSTVHRQKVKLVRKSQSKEDSELLRSGRKSSTPTIKNNPLCYTELVQGIVLSGNNKAAPGVRVYEMSPKHARLRLDTCKNRLDVCSKTSPINGVSGGEKHSRNLKCSGSSDFSSTRFGNTPCSKTLKSLSRHGAKEYLTLSSKKSLESCSDRTPTLNSGNDGDSVVKSTAEKTTDIQISKNLKKLVIPTRESTRTECDNTKKRCASDKYSGEKQPMKRVCLLDRFRDDHGQEETGTSKNSDSAHLCTVDTNPNTNGGLLQQFVVDSSLENSKKGRTRVRIRRGQLVRKRTANAHKSLADKSGNVFAENSIEGNISCKENRSVVGSSSNKDMSASLESDKTSCIVSGKEVTQRNQNSDQCKKMSTLQNTNTVSTYKSALNSNSNSKYCQTVCSKENSTKLQHADQVVGNNEGSTDSTILHKNLEDTSMNRKAVSTTTPTMSLQADPTSTVLLQGDRNNEKTLHNSRRTGRKEEALYGPMEDDFMSTCPDQIFPTLSSTDDSRVDLRSNNEDAVAMVSDKVNIELKQVFSSSNTECRSKPLHSEKSETGTIMNDLSSRESKCLVPSTDNSEVGTSINNLSSCESKTLEFHNDKSEECSACVEENVSDLSPSSSSDDESEPLVFYRHSCRTLPLCALLKLAGRQKLVHDLSMNISDTVKENTGYGQENQQSVCSDENDLSGKSKNFSSLSQEVKDMSHPKMTGLISSYDEEAVTPVTSLNMSSTDSPNNNSVGITGVSECSLVDPQTSVSVLETITVSRSEKSDKMSKSSESTYKHSSDQDNSEYPPSDQVHSTSPLENTTLAQCYVKPQGANRGKHPGEKSDHHGNYLPQALDTNHDNLPPLPGEVQCNVSVGPCVVMEGSDKVTQSEIRTDTGDLGCSRTNTDVLGSSRTDTGDLGCSRTDTGVLGCSKRSTSTDCTLSSLKSIADGNLTEISKSESQRFSTNSEDDERDVSDETAEPDAGEDVDNELCDRNQLQGNIMDSDDVVDGSDDECLVDSSLNNVPDHCLDDNSVILKSMKCLDDHKNYNHENSMTSSRLSDNGTSICFLKGPDLCFKPYQIEVQQNLPRNVMSTCNVVGTFADDMVTGMINVIDMETNSADSSCDTGTNSSGSPSVSSKLHDYCARQISFQNFLHWKLDEDLNGEFYQDNSICARMLSYQAFHKTKAQSLLSYGKHLEDIPQLCDTKVLQGEEHSGNTLTEKDQPFYSLGQEQLTGSDSKEMRPTEQTAVTDNKLTRTRSEEQPELAKRGEQPVFDITFVGRPEQLVTTELNAVLSESIHGSCEGIHANSEGIRANSEGIHANSEGIHANSEGIHASSEGIHASSEGIHANSEGIRANSEGIHASSEGIRTSNESVCASRESVCSTSEGVSRPANTEGVFATIDGAKDISEGACANSEIVCAISCNYMKGTISKVVDETSLDSEDNRNISRSCVPNVVSTDINQNVSVRSGTESCRLNAHVQLSDDLVSLCNDKGEPSEEECEDIYTSNQANNCARVQPFETNIMHKFSDKTKLLFQEYHDRQQNSMDISYSNTEEKSSRLETFSGENQTQTVSSLEENECSVYEMYIPGSVSSGNSNSTNNQNKFKGNTGTDGTHSGLNKTFSAQKLKNAKELANPRSIDDSVVSSCDGLTGKSDMVPFKSSMNIINLEDISTSLLNQQNILLSESEQRYLKSPKKLWYRNYMGRISPAEEGRGDNPKTTSETSSHQKACVFPGLDSEGHNDIEDEQSGCLDPSIAKSGKENTPEKNRAGETRNYSESLEFIGQLSETVAVNGEESLAVSVRQSDDDYASDTTGRFDVCSRMRQFRKRRSCARACRDGYVSGCARSRLFVKKTNDES